MVMASSVRKIALTAHVTSSVGWLGSVAGFLALAVAGITSEDAQTVRSAYISMDFTTWFVIVPLAFASLLTGVASSLGTRWGLFRYYWVFVKLLIAPFATVVLLVHIQPIDLLAGASVKASTFGANLHQAQILMVVASGAAVVALLALTTLSIYKPRGMTPYGARKHPE